MRGIIRYIIFSLLTVMSVSIGRTQNAPITHLKGLVRDSVTHEPLPYASYLLVGGGIGGLTDENGRFEVKTGKSFSMVEVSLLGYTSKRVPARRRTASDIVIDLAPDGVQLNEVVVTKQKDKYSKKNNPAVELLNRIISAKELTDPRRNDFYNYNKYERINIALNDFNPDSGQNSLVRKFKFLKDHVDTSEVSGHPILNISTREKSSQIHYRKNPKDEKEYVTGIRRVGLDDFLDQQSLQTFYEDVLREIDLYGNDVTILQNKFVSPLSRIAADFYKFYINDTIEMGNELCIELLFVPRNSQTFGFTGRIYVSTADSTMFIKKVTMGVPKDINLNFIDKLYIEQEFDRAPDGSRLKTRDDMTAEMSIVPGMQGMYVRRNTAYSDHDFARRSDEKELFKPMERIVEMKDAINKTTEFWDDHRLIPMSDSESNVESMVTKLRSMPLYYWTEKVVKILVSGYIQTGKNSKFDVGPMNTTISGNTIEGLRMRAGGMTTANLSKRWFMRGYGAYGTKDHKWKYRGEVEYSFHDKTYHSREFPIHSLRATQMYDVDMLGQHYEFTNADNMFLSLKRKSDTQMTYHQVSQLEYTLELRNNFSILAGFKFERQESTVYMPFTNGFGRSFGHYDQAQWSLQLRYAPGEKFYQTKSYRIPINFDAPIFVLTHTYSPKNFLGSMFDVNKTEMSIQKRFWFSAFGYTDIILKGGHVWSRSAYPNLLLPNANLSYTIQPESYSLMNAMEFINDSYAGWDVTYYANGTIFNYIPYFKKLKLREVFSCRGLFGHLSKRNDPAYNDMLFRFPADAHTQKMNHTPYVEVGVGVENIFKFLRVDYVWRLTYLDNPGIDKSGLRIALHFTF